MPLVQGRKSARLSGGIKNGFLGSRTSKKCPLQVNNHGHNLASKVESSRVIPLFQPDALYEQIAKMTLLETASRNASFFSIGGQLPLSSCDLGVYCPIYDVPAGCGHTIWTYRANWTAKLCLECLKLERAKYKKSLWKKYYGEKYRERRNLLKSKQTA